MHARLLYRVLLAVGTSLQCASALPESHTDDQVNAAIKAGTFENPSANVRPRFRYWVPDASADLAAVVRDIASAKTAGAGGVELLGYYNYGGNAGDYVPVDWSTYGWGTPAWKGVLDTAIQAHIDNGLVMDFAMGPNQGQGVPAQEDDEGLSWDLAFFSTSIPINGSFSGTIPGWGSGKLQAVISALATDSVVTSASEPGLPNNQYSSRTQVTLAARSLRDVTSKVNNDGHLKLNYGCLTNQPAGLERIIFAVYLYKLGARNQVPPQVLKGPQTVPPSWVYNGSWYVDHFSAKGAKVMTDFWEQYLLTNGTKEKIQASGNYAWEDSIEVNPNIYWTPDLPAAFQARRNYSINVWLPILFHQNSLIGHYGTWYITDEPDAGNSHIADYRTTLTELYAEYLEALTSWANDYLGVQFSSQVGYNMAVDMESNIPLVNAPECESLAFFNDIDGYRQYTGPANMAGKRVISTECCANPGETYQQPLPEIVWFFKQSLAGSVNQIVFHGYPYSGEYPNTTWPGWATFTYAFSEMHGERQPAWDFYSDPLNYISRLQYIFQSGIPKMDLAFYHKWTGYAQIPTSYAPTDLLDTGYSYAYLNPNNLQLPEAYVKNGVLAPERQAYKALIVSSTDSLTVSGAMSIAKIARDGLPVIFYGGLPTYLASFNTSGSAYAKETLQSILGLPNVHVTAAANLAETVELLGIQPLTRVKANTTWYTYWRRVNADATDYVFVYNDSPGGSTSPGVGVGEGTVEFQSIGQPYLLDAWSGAKTPILNYTQTDSSTTIYIKLAANQAAVIAFVNDETPASHAVFTSGNVLAIVSSSGSGGKGNLVAHVGYSSDSAATVITSDGRQHSLATASAPPFDLKDWKLTVEHWDPPTPLTDMDAGPAKSNTTHSLPTLVSWQKIDNLQHVSGRGYYKTTFQWPPSVSSGTSGSADGALISFGTVVHTLRVSVNGKQVPTLDVTNAVADISAFLVDGVNTVEAVVATQLGNVLAPIWNDLRTTGIPPTGVFGSSTAPSGTTDYGLLYPVVVTPYHAVALV